MGSYIRSPPSLPSLFAPPSQEHRNEGIGCPFDWRMYVVFGSFFFLLFFFFPILFLFFFYFCLVPLLSFLFSFFPLFHSPSFFSSLFHFHFHFHFHLIPHPPLSLGVGVECSNVPRTIRHAHGLAWWRVVNIATWDVAASR